MDQNYYRRNLWVLSFTGFLAASSWNQIMPFLALFIKDLGVTKDVAMWSGIVYSSQWIATAFMGPYWGKLADKYGRKLMVMRAGVCLAGIYVAMSFCQNVYELSLLRIINGILTGFIPASITLIATNTPESVCGRYVSIAQSAVAAGGIAGPMVGGVLAGLFGYRGSMVVSGVAVAIATGMVWLLVQERHKPVTSEVTSLWQDYKLGFKMPVLVTAMLGDMFGAIVLNSILPILALYIQPMAGKYINTASGIIFALPGLAFVLTGYSWSRLGERMSYRNTLIVGMLGLGIFMVLQGICTNLFWFGVCYFIMGVFGAAINPSTAALLSSNIDSNFRGRAYGMLLAARTIGSFVAALVAGVVGDLVGLNWVFILMGLVGLTGMVIIRSHSLKWFGKEPQPITGEVSEAG